MSEIGLLRTIPLFNGLTDEQVSAMLAVVTRKRVPAGTVILREGDRSNSLFMLASGSVEMTKADFEQVAESDNALAYRVVRNISIVLASRLRHSDRDILKLTIALSLALGNR